MTKEVPSSRLQALSSKRDKSLRVMYWRNNKCPLVFQASLILPPRISATFDLYASQAECRADLGTGTDSLTKSRYTLSPLGDASR